MAAVLPGSGFTSAVFVFQSLYSLFCLVVMDSAAWLSNDTQLFFSCSHGWLGRSEGYQANFSRQGLLTHTHPQVTGGKKHLPGVATVSVQIYLGQFNCVLERSSQDKDSFNRLCRFIADCLMFSGRLVGWPALSSAAAEGGELECFLASVW